MTEDQEQRILALLENIQEIMKKNLATVDAQIEKVDLIINWLPKIPNAK